MNAGQKEILKLVFLRRLHYRFLIVFLSLMAAVLGLAVPYYQKIFSETLSQQSLAICVVLALGYLASNQLTLFFGQSESVETQRHLSQRMYEQNLKLMPLTLQNRAVGEMVSLYATDVPSVTVWLEQSLPYGLTTLFPLVLTPFFLNSFYDLPLTVSLSFVGALILINSLMAYRQAIFFFRFKILAAARMGLVNEWIQNIRGLKILNWIEGFENKIIKKRREETVNRIQMVTNGQIMNAISSNIMFWLNLLMLAFFIWFYDKPLHKSDIIALLWVTTVFLSRPLRQLPWFFTFLFDAWTSFNRVADFFNLRNTPEVIGSTARQHADSVLEISHLNLYIGPKHVLQNIDVTIKKQEIVALIGPVGSGKTLLLKSMIKETPFKADHFFSEQTSYLPQEHFIMSASLRDNMNFLYQSDRARDPIVMKHLEKAQFSFELDRLQDGLETVVGERGVNLSGGQKQRVSLARQLLSPAPLLILDDPLSAVDVATENKLIEELKLLKKDGYSVLLTTQRFTALPSCDRIVFLRNGHIEYNGPSTEFLEKPEYHSFLKGLV